MMFNKVCVKFICLVGLISFAVKAETFNRVEQEIVDNADFYLFDITDHRTKVIQSIDAYIIDGETYVAVTPLITGLRIKLSVSQNTFLLEHADRELEIELSELTVGLSEETSLWFNDGVYNFIPMRVFAEFFGSEYVVNTASLAINLFGHTEDLPYKKFKNNQMQRRANQFLTGKTTDSSSLRTESIITVPDQYRLYSVPNGYASIDYYTNGTNERFNGVVQTVSDLAYHSTELTVNRTEEETFSFMRMSRYPSAPNEKILGFIDTYSFGDIWSRSASISRDQSRGLGLSVSSNFIEGGHENFTTSFTKAGKPGWEADIFHNGRFLETRTVPEDGLMEFINMEVYYGRNEFKIVMFGPYGEKEELIEEVEVRRTPLGQGDSSFNFNILEYDSSLLDINSDEFDIDGLAGNMRFGVLDNWMTGINFSISDIHGDNGLLEAYTLSNQVSLPDWYLDNRINFSENEISQSTSVATSIFAYDSLILKYESLWAKDSEESEPTRSSFDLNYNIRTGSLGHSLGYFNGSEQLSSSERVQYRTNYYGYLFNLSNLFTYQKKQFDDTGIVREDVLGTFGVSTRISSNLRLNASIPYDVKNIEEFDESNISLSMNYYLRQEESNHNFQLSTRSLLDENIWSVGYNMAFNRPTHQFTFSTTYNSNDDWTVRAGIVVNFGYDYFNNSLFLSNERILAGGTLDVNAFLDRRLNGIPDVLDHQLEGVTFSGRKGWAQHSTNKQGKARLFGAGRGATALSASWQSAGRTLNQDYLVYSHPGSQHNVNLPFYLTTELEFFVSLVTNDNYIPLANAPIMARNMSTGDVYELESDIDGYVNFVNLLPGKYIVEALPQWLDDNSYTSEFYGFSFEAPATGGFVVLPNLELSRSNQEVDAKSRLQEVKLNENNFEPLIDKTQHKLIHLPPKGGFQAPHSSDNVKRAIFKRLRQESTREDRIELREKLDSEQLSGELWQQKQAKSVGLGTSTILGSEQTTEETSYMLSIGGFESLSFAQRFASSIAKPFSYHQGINSVGKVIYFVKYDEFSSQQEAEEFRTKTFRDYDFRINKVISEPKSLSGWVIQYAAAKTLEEAIEQASAFEVVSNLHIARKLVNGQYWYCLISRGFFDRDAATKFLSTAREDGFLVNSSNYIDTVWSK